MRPSVSVHRYVSILGFVLVGWLLPRAAHGGCVRPLAVDGAYAILTTPERVDSYTRVAVAERATSTQLCLRSGDHSLPSNADWHIRSRLGPQEVIVVLRPDDATPVVANPPNGGPVEADCSGVTYCVLRPAQLLGHELSEIAVTVGNEPTAAFFFDPMKGEIYTEPAGEWGAAELDRLGGWALMLLLWAAFAWQVGRTRAAMRSASMLGHSLGAALLVQGAVGVALLGLALLFSEPSGVGVLTRLGVGGGAAVAILVAAGVVAALSYWRGRAPTMSSDLDAFRLALYHISTRPNLPAMDAVHQSVEPTGLAQTIVDRARRHTLETVASRLADAKQADLLEAMKVLHASEQRGVARFAAVETILGEQQLAQPAGDEVLALLNQHRRLWTSQSLDAQHEAFERSLAPTVEALAVLREYCTSADSEPARQKALVREAFKLMALRPD